MASDASTSASVVRHDDIGASLDGAAAPLAGGDRAGAVGQHPSTELAGRLVVTAAHQHLGEHDVVDDLETVDRRARRRRSGRALAHSRSTRAATPVRSEAAQGRPHREAASPARELRRLAPAGRRSRRSGSRRARRRRPGSRPGPRRSPGRSRTGRSASCGRRSTRSRRARSQRSGEPSGPGAALAQRPKAPSTWTQASCRCAISISGSNGSNAPVWTSPACRQTITGPSIAWRGVVRGPIRLHPPLAVALDEDEVLPAEPEVAGRPVDRVVPIRTDHQADPRRRRPCPARATSQPSFESTA